MSDEAAAWPQACRYLVPQLVNADSARQLVKIGFEYLEPDAKHHQELCFVDLGNTGATLRSVSQKSDAFPERLRTEDVPQDGTRVFFIYYKRHYVKNSTRNAIFVTLQRWFEILGVAMVLPSVIELLADHNGGLASHVSYCSDNPRSPCDTPFRRDAPCAYHICIKKGDQGYGERFIYARHDFHSKKTFMLVLDRLNDDDIDSFINQFHGRSSVHLFAIINTVLTPWFEQVETTRQKVDVETQQLESQTGHSTLFYRAKPLAPDQLTLRRDISIVADRLRLLKTSASYMGEIYSFVATQVRRFNDLSTSDEPTPPLYRQIGDAFAQRQSQCTAQVNQISNLSSRAEAQWNIVNALLSQHNNKLNTDMARDSRIDNVLMRRISFVTIVFLPATFMATFFSMVFFATDSDGLRVNKWIWLYVVCTVPLTLVLATQYGHHSGNITQVFDALKKMFSKKRQTS